MRNRKLLAALLAAAVLTGGCGLSAGTGSQITSATQNESVSEAVLSLDTEDGKPFIEEVGGTEESSTETEDDFYMIVPDTETESASGTETEAASGTETEAETEAAGADGPVAAVLTEIIDARTALGEKWAVAYEDLATGQQYGYHESDVMQSASVVKLFIMGAVYRYMCYPAEGEEAIPFNESYDGELRDTINSMITVSDNDAANLLIERLGGGDFQAGAGLIGEFCEENGYTGTSIGRRFLESDPSGDNYTSAADTRKFLSDLYHGKLVSEEASEKMLAYVKDQTRKNKIPAGLPEGFTSGNKTGEMPEGYNLGCIENDCAIVFPPEGMGEGYVLTVLSNDLGGRNSEAISAITQISSMTAAWYTEQQG